MKLLIVTQTIDINDPVLGFFCRWVEEFAKHCEKVTVICLHEGIHSLPNNVRVTALGKTRVGRVFDFLHLCISRRSEYDTVFVHMNQEYVLIAGWLWKLLGKRTYLWRNHYAGSWLTDVAAVFCTKVFCTSKHSYTVKYKKTVLMPVGVDTERFTPGARHVRKPHSILFLARMASSKRPELFLDALAMLARAGTRFTATFVGSPAPGDESYYAGLKAHTATLGFEDAVIFLPAVTNADAVNLYRTHEIFVNASPSGMLDKTIFEAAASGCIVLAASTDFADAAGEDSQFNSAAELAARLVAALAGKDHRPPVLLVEENSLRALTEKLIGAMITQR